MIIHNKVKISFLDAELVAWKGGGWKGGVIEEGNGRGEVVTSGSISFRSGGNIRSGSRTIRQGRKELLVNN